MSITQEYERFRKQIGNKKYDALEHYIDTHGKIEEWEQGVKDIRKIEDIQDCIEKTSKEYNTTIQNGRTKRKV